MLRVMLRLGLLLSLSLALGACSPGRAQDSSPPPASSTADGRTAARLRVTALERQVVEDQERLREAQLGYDALRDQYLLLRDAAAALTREDEAARAAARDAAPYRALVTNLRDAANELEQHGGGPPELRATLARLADLMQASEVRPADADEAARWARYLADGREQARGLRATDQDAAAAAGRVLDAFVRVCWFWSDLDQDRAAATGPAAAEGTAVPEEIQRVRRELPQASQLYQEALDELEDAKRALREHESALSEARAASRRARANPSG